MDEEVPRAAAAAEFSQENIDRLKGIYSTEMKDDPENPIKVCMKLVFEAATEKDQAKRDKLALEISQFLTRPNGVINLFLALIDFDTTSEKVTTHNQRFLAVAKIITFLPKLCMPYLDYCRNISGQLRPLLVHPNTLYSSLAAIIMKTLLESPHATSSTKQQDHKGQVAQVVVGPILAALTSKSSHGTMKKSDATLAVHNLIQNHLPTSLFVGHFANLFFCLLALYDTPSGLKCHLKSSLVRIINDLPPGPACCLIEKTIFHDASTSNTYRMLAEDDEITVEIVKEATQANSPVMGADELVIDVLESCDNNLLVMEFFFHFQARMWTTCDAETTRRCATLIGPLLGQTIEEKPDNKLDILGSILSNGERAQELINRTLINYLDFLRLEEHRHDNDKFASEAQNLAESSISSCLNILEVLSTSATSESEPSERMRSRTLPTLEEIKTILVRGRRGRETNKKLIQSLDTLIEMLSSACESNSRGPNDQVGNESDSISKGEHANILRDLNDKLVPVRVHAIVRLRQLLIANDKFTVRQIGQLYPMVECSLADQEPYVFLASINLLAEMSLRQTDLVLPKLIDLYTRSELDTQQRLNVGEVLVRLTKQMNETTPHYAAQIMNALLGLALDQSAEEHVRMSSLTNIGFVCASLGNSLGKYMVEVLASVRTILDSPTTTLQVKCAAVDLLRTTLMGLDRNNFESVQRDLHSLYGLLKSLAQRTLDEKMCLQVSLALEEIGRLAKDIIGVGGGGSSERQSGERLVKNIKVLSLD